MSWALELSGVGFARGARRVLEGVELRVAAGETVAVAGASGSGKTTLLRLVLGLETPAAGTIRLHGREVSRAGRLLVPPEQRGLAVVFQELALWPHLSVAGNLELVLAVAGVAKAERRARSAAMLARVGLAARARARPGELSGGERQRVAIARALVSEPTLVLLDEPFANLDVALRHELAELFRTLLHQQRATALLVTHDPAEAAALAARIAVLEGGRIDQVAPPDALELRPESAFTRAFVGVLRDRLGHGRAGSR